MIESTFEQSYQMKCDEKAFEFFKTGDDFYEKKELLDALINYNKTIAFAELSDLLVYGYIRRCTTLCSLGRYKECLENVEWLRVTYNPKEKILVEMEKMCKEQLEEEEEIDDPFEFFKLTYPPNKKIPWLADCVEMRWTKKYKRGIYATRDLKAGDIIGIEEAMVPILTSDACYARCANCFKSHYMVLFPCDKSASYMFCSTNCKEDFYAKAIDLNTMIHPDMQILSEVIGSFGGVKKFDAFLKNIKWKKLKKTIFDYDFSDPNDPKYKENKIMCLLSLPTNNDKMKIHGEFYSSKHVSSKNVQFLVSLYLLNTTADIRLNISSNLGVCGESLPLFCNLVNHCCDSNIEYTFADNKIITYITKPIKKGEQLFLNYCGNSEEDRMKIQEHLYRFQCDCKFCINKEKLPEQEKDLKAILYVVTKNYDKAKEHLEEAWDNINNNPEHQNRWSRYAYGSSFIMNFFGSLCTLPH